MMEERYPGKTRKEGLGLYQVSVIEHNWRQVRGTGYWLYKGTALLDLHHLSQDI